MVSPRFSLPFAPSLDESHWTTGNFHALLLFRNDEELAIVREAVHRMVERAIKMEGTCKFRILYDYHTRWSQFNFGRLTICFLITQARASMALVLANANTSTRNLGRAP
jgi:hypothetical protein